MGGLWQKLDCADFVSFLLLFDVVCLTETFIDTDFQSDVFKDHLSFTAKVTTTTHDNIWEGCPLLGPAAERTATAQTAVRREVNVTGSGRSSPDLITCL